MEQIFVYKILKLALAISAIFMFIAFISAISILKKCSGDKSKKDPNTKGLFKQTAIAIFLFLAIFFGIQGFYVWRINTCNE